MHSGETLDGAAGGRAVAARLSTAAHRLGRRLGNETALVTPNGRSALLPQLLLKLLHLLLMRIAVVLDDVADRQRGGQRSPRSVRRALEFGAAGRRGGLRILNEMRTARGEQVVLPQQHLLLLLLVSGIRELIGLNLTGRRKGVGGELAASGDRSVAARRVTQTTLRRSLLLLVLNTAIG